MKLISTCTLFLICLTLAGQSTDKRRKVEIQTQYGNMIVELYNETPKHRDNFIKLVSQKYYDDLIFHRVIKNFMIQGGDPNSRNAQPNEQLGNGGPEYTIDAEFLPQFIHKKGALSAARQGDNVNPLKKSSGSQFYVVQGNVVPPQQLTAMQSRASQNQIQALTRQYMAKNPKIEAKIKSFQDAGLHDSVNEIFKSVMELVQKTPEYKPVQYSEQQIQAYSTLGGTPHLDGGYTVFGEVVSGLHIVDSIAAQPTGQADRPKKDVKMKMRIIQ
jgi:cyclophilin family peptidyl-prolyl cis-trans isomerase